MIKSRAKTLVKAMAHQSLSLDHDASTPVIFDTSDPGTGKTYVRVVAFSQRRRKRGGCALVIAPKSLLDSAWAADFKKFAPDMTVSVATADNREKAFAVVADAYITNTDAVKWLVKQPKAFWAKFSELIIDESPTFKHHTSQRSRAMAKLVPNFKRRACLTGTPNGNTICDVWHQVYLLDGGKRLGPSFYGFRASVSVPEQVGRRAEAVRWVDKDGAEEAVFGLISDITVRHKFEDCVDIPANHSYVVDFTLTPKMRKAYDTMERDHLLPMLLPKQVVAATKARMLGVPQVIELSGVNAAAVGTKLLQIASGSVLDNDGKVHLIDDARYKLVMELADARKHSIVFYYWNHQLVQLQKEADARGMTHCSINGDTTDAERRRFITGYQAGFYRTVFIHPASGAHGLTLTRGTATIWPGPTANLEWYVQGGRRNYRIGQTQKTENIMVLGDTTVEQRVYWDLLMGKNKRMTTFLDLFAAMTQDYKLAA